MIDKSKMRHDRITLFSNNRFTNLEIIDSYINTSQLFSLSVTYYVCVHTYVKVTIIISVLLPRVRNIYYSARPFTTRIYELFWQSNTRVSSNKLYNSAGAICNICIVRYIMKIVASRAC